MMKKKTILSILTLFFLLQIKTIQPSNYIWDILTSPVFSWSLCAGFFGITKIASKWVPTFEKIEKNNQIRTEKAEERSAKRVAIFSERNLALVEESRKLDLETQANEVATALTLLRIQNYSKPMFRKFRRTIKNQELFFKYEFQKASDNISAQNFRTCAIDKHEIDSEFKEIQNDTTGKLEKIKETTSQFIEESEGVNKELTKKFQVLQQSSEQNSREIQEKTDLLTQQVHSIENTINHEIQTIESQQPKLKELERLQKEREEIIQIISRINEEQYKVHIQAPKLPQNSKKLLIELDKQLPSPQRFLTNIKD